MNASPPAPPGRASACTLQPSSPTPRVRTRRLHPPPRRNRFGAIRSAVLVLKASPPPKATSWRPPQPAGALRLGDLLQLARRLRTKRNPIALEARPRPARGRLSNHLRGVPVVSRAPHIPTIPIGLVAPQLESTQPTEASCSQPSPPYRAPVGTKARTNHAEAPAPDRCRPAHSGTPAPVFDISPNAGARNRHNPQTGFPALAKLQFTLPSHTVNPVHPVVSES